MAVRAGQILFDIDGFVIDRIQTGGVNSLNIQSTKVSEVGDFQTVGIVRDIPDLSFQLNSLDVSTDIESMMCNTVPTSVVAGTGASPSGTALSFLNTRPIDVVSPFRAAQTTYNIVQGIIVPFLNLESVEYKYGLKANAEETFTLKGDAIYYVPGVPVHETAAGGSTSYSLAWGPAVEYQELGQTIYVLSVWWSDNTTGLGKRLFHQQDYTDTTTGFTLTSGVTIPGTAVVHYCYGAVTPAPTALPTPTAPFYYGANVNTPQSVKPAAIRSKDMDVYVGVGGVMERLTGVQSFDATWKVTLDMFEEFGNAHYVSEDFNFADVSGSVGMKGVDPFDTITKIQNLIGIPNNQIAGTLTYPEVEIECRLRNPETHALLKTIYIPDAQFVAPAISARANQQLDFTLNFDGATGTMIVYDGERIGGEI